MATEVIADRRKFFELFTQVKNRSVMHGDPSLSSLVDSCIELWTKMFKADAEHDRTIAKNVHALQVCLPVQFKRFFM